MAVLPLLTLTSTESPLSLITSSFYSSFYQPHHFCLSSGSTLEEWTLQARVGHCWWSVACIAGGLHRRLGKGWGVWMKGGDLSQSQLTVEEMGYVRGPREYGASQVHPHWCWSSWKDGAGPSSHVGLAYMQYKGRELLLRFGRCTISGAVVR